MGVGYFGVFEDFYFGFIGHEVEGVEAGWGVHLLVFCCFFDVTGKIYENLEKDEFNTGKKGKIKETQDVHAKF